MLSSNQRQLLPPGCNVVGGSRARPPRAARAAPRVERARASRDSAAPGAADPPVQAIIFDVDGVLCSSEHLSREAAAEVMRRLHGLDVAPDEFIPFGGQGEERFLGGVAEKYGVAGYDPAAAKGAFFDVYINTYCRGPGAARIAFPGAVALVRACAAAGLATAVASSAERVKVDANLAAAGFDAAADFGCVVSGSSFERNKPAPDIFLAAAAGLRAEPRHCVVLEDTEAGVAAARAAGMRVVGVTTTLHEDAMRALAPDAVWRDVSALSVADLCAVRYAAGAPAGAAPAGDAAAAAEAAAAAAAGQAAAAAAAAAQREQ